MSVVGANTLICIHGDTLEIVPNARTGYTGYDHDIKYWQKMKDETTKITHLDKDEFEKKLQDLKKRHCRNSVIPADDV